MADFLLKNFNIIQLYIFLQYQLIFYTTYELNFKN